MTAAMETGQAPRLGARGIEKVFAAPVLRGIDFDLLPGEVHALVGENGAGKSTFARILCGYQQADAGTLRIDGGEYRPRDRNAACAKGVRLVRQEIGTIDTLSVAENLFLEALPRFCRRGLIDRRALHAAARTALADLGLHALDPATPVATLGIGLRQVIEIAAALAQPCSVLVLDEPTAALSPHETEQLFLRITRLRAEGGSVLYISHRLEELRRICDRVTVLRDGKLVETLPAHSAKPEHLVRLMAGTSTTPARTATAGGATAQQPNKAKDLVEPVLQVTGLASGDRVHDVSLAAYPGEILGLAGLVGAGRSETLRALFGADPVHAGRITLFGQTLRLHDPRAAVHKGLAFLGEDRKRSGLLLPLSVRTNLTLCRLPGLRRTGLLRPRAEADLSRTLAQDFDVRARSLDQPIALLSGGNQQKALFARALSNAPRILLCDEPTRGIDVGARRELHARLRAFAAEGNTVLVASSDLEELLSLCDRIVVLSLGRSVATFNRRAHGGEDTGMDAPFDSGAILAAAFSGHLQGETPAYSQEVIA